MKIEHSKDKANGVKSQQQVGESGYTVYTVFLTLFTFFQHFCKTKIISIFLQTPFKNKKWCLQKYETMKSSKVAMKEIFF